MEILEMILSKCYNVLIPNRRA